MEEVNGVTHVKISGPIGTWALKQLLKKTIKSKLGASCDIDFGDIALRLDEQHARLTVDYVDISLSAEDFKNLLKN